MNSVYYSYYTIVLPRLTPPPPGLRGLRGLQSHILIP